MPLIFPKSSRRSRLEAAALGVALLVALAFMSYGVELVRARIWADALQHSGCRGLIHE